MLAFSEGDELYLRGIERFNEGDFFEAHEVWEDVWHMAAGDEKRLYQGLIQAAVTLVHVQRGNPRGVVRVWASAQAKLAGLRGVVCGLDVELLQREMGAFVEPVLKLPAEAFGPGVRGLSLPVDWRDAPRIRLVTP